MSLRLSCRALLIVVLVGQPDFYSAVTGQASDQLNPALARVFDYAGQKQ